MDYRKREDCTTNPKWLRRQLKRSAADQSFFWANARRSKTRGAQIISGKRYFWLRGQLSAKFHLFNLAKAFDDSCVFYLADPLHVPKSKLVGRLHSGVEPHHLAHPMLSKKYASNFFLSLFSFNFFCNPLFQCCIGNNSCSRAATMNFVLYSY